ncbi:MAG: hypothetical protein Q3963_02030 [Coriobacteriaceae bacterium]|nr:hypothetical protein [Coriobacteriaceae bacterium]
MMTRFANKASIAMCAFALAIVAVCAAMIALPNAAQATESDDYTYTVRVWGGNQGKVDGQNDKGYAEKTDIEYPCSGRFRKRQVLCQGLSYCW